MSDREIDFADRFASILRTVIQKNRFHGLEILSVKREFPISGKEADIACLLSHGPLLFIETKRLSENKRSKVYSIFDSVVIGQAISYCAFQERLTQQRVPYFITATPKRYAVFKTPKNIDEFVNISNARRRIYERVIKPGKLHQFFNEYLLRSGELRLREEFVVALLDDVVKDYLEIEKIKIPITYSIINFFNDFVDAISYECESLIRFHANSEFKRKIIHAEEEIGITLVQRDENNEVVNADILTRMMVYVLLNKILFYKILEMSYRDLPRLVSLGYKSSTRYMDRLNELFEMAMEVTNDFEPIFNADLFNDIKLPDENELLRFIDRFIDVIDQLDMAEIGQLIGYSYENVIPPEERHQLGQFYTPPAIAEFITKWCIRSAEDRVLDPGVGSGTFLTEAYRQLYLYKTGLEELPASSDVHNKILEQLYAIDINPFPLQLASMSLAMKNVRAPSTQINTILSDFFIISPGQSVLSPYIIKTPAGDLRRSLVIPDIDVVIGNPPYTRWTEISDNTRTAISNSIGNLLSKYKMRPGAVRSEPMIFTHFILQSDRFLKNGGRMGMIISNLWMQTDYGINFGNFLLDNYKIKVIIDFTLRLFNALISTCIILLEKCNSLEKRVNNDVIFIHIPGQINNINVNELFDVIDKKDSEKYYIKNIKQKDIPKDNKWLNVFLSDEDYYSSEYFVTLDNYFEPFRGNFEWSKYSMSHGARPDVGSSAFHYMTPSKIKYWGLSDYIYPKSNEEDAVIWPAITSSRQAKHFTFTKKDWDTIRKKDGRCYIFSGNKKINELPVSVVKYIEWGENECRTKIRESRGGGKLANETDSAKKRAESRNFNGWYDLGKVEITPIMAIYQAWWKTRFILCKYPLALYHAIVSFFPKNTYEENELKAILSYLNSSFTQYYIETRGRRSGGGIIGLEVSVANKLPILNIKKLNEDEIILLSNKFDELESETRIMGGASTKEQYERIKSKIYDIDNTIAEIIGFSKDKVNSLQSNVDKLVNRRVTSAKGVKPDSVVGKQKPIRLIPEKKKKRKRSLPVKTLDRFIR